MADQTAGGAPEAAPIAIVHVLISTPHLERNPDDKIPSPLLIGTNKSVFPELVPNKLLHITARLGLPLYWCPFPINTIKASLYQGPTITETTNQQNPIFERFGIRKTRTPEQKGFGVQPFSGSIMLARVDGKDLLHEQVWAMWYYIGAIQYTISTLKINITDYEAFDTAMAPENIVKLWDQAHPDVECPVTLDCLSCGKQAGEGEAALLKCGKCGVARYCGKECQKAHWAAHKKVCTQG